MTRPPQLAKDSIPHNCLCFTMLDSVLHNPHLGLSDTLHQLYDLAKKFADCVVPQGRPICATLFLVWSHCATNVSKSICPTSQEYGTTIAEKRSVGLKICHGLLEKIKFDLSVARQDKNQADIRYMVRAFHFVSSGGRAS